LLHLTAPRGDTTVLEFTVTRSGVPVNLTGLKIWFTVKTDRSVADASATIRKGTAATGMSGITLPGAGTDGRYWVQIDPADTSSLADGTQWFYYDTQIREADARVTTVETGRFAVTTDVTKATS